MGMGSMRKGFVSQREIGMSAAVLAPCAHGCSWVLRAGGSWGRALGGPAPHLLGALPLCPSVVPTQQLLGMLAPYLPGGPDSAPIGGPGPVSTRSPGPGPFGGASPAPASSQPITHGWPQPLISWSPSPVPIGGPSPESTGDPGSSPTSRGSQPCAQRWCWAHTSSLGVAPALCPPRCRGCSPPAAARCPCSRPPARPGASLRPSTSRGWRSGHKRHWASRG